METQPLESIIETAVLAADAKGATDQVALNVAEQFGYADAFLIVSGSVERNVQAISDNIEDELNRSGIRTVRREGRSGGRWVLLDFGDLLVHVFHHEDREFYQLERLWGDCPSIEVNDTLERARLAHEARLEVE
ncbi:ribosome silencing factor [Leucobacter sp. cx-328]|uniref:ribosome silencing factor n=1 Tax=unclassified Leucobacter TaxID=2621730 RepID=UPI00165D9C29|nr:ribosome silencing factor [Leucobacter sp. cx-328]